jgi:hypothetical protein
MVIEVPPDRVRCRRCETKLPNPTPNELEAFCCKGCFRIYYSKRCLICEESADKLLCGKRKCRISYQGRKRHATLGRYQVSAKSKTASANPIKIGVSESTESRPEYRIVAGPRLTPTELHCATIGADEVLEQNLAVNHRFWLEAQDRPASHMAGRTTRAP